MDIREILLVYWSRFRIAKNPAYCPKYRKPPINYGYIETCSEKTGLSKPLIAPADL